MQVAGIIHNDVINGPGLRCTVFMQGCAHACPGCHSAHTWPFNSGKTMTVEELVADICSNPLDHALTLSGGDPIYQVTELKKVVKACKCKGMHILVYTGYSKEELEQLCHQELVEKRFTAQDLIEFLSEIDLIICDRFEQDKRSLELKFRGSTNQRVVIPHRQHNTIIFEDVTAEWDAGEDYC